MVRRKRPEGSRCLLRPERSRSPQRPEGILMEDKVLLKEGVGGYVQISPLKVKTE
jgi:hypothetical protein